MIDLIEEKLNKNPENRMPFEAYMNLALYAPEKGYYTGNREIFGRSGDFITAPELTPYLAKAIAHQLAQVFDQHRQLPKVILEFGAGSGKFSLDLMDALAQLGIVIERYVIVEVSSFLRERQQKMAEQKPDYLEKMMWLSQLPAANQFSGIVIANEVLDAFPVHRFLVKDGEIFEQSVTLDSLKRLQYGEPLPIGPALKNHLEGIQSRCGQFEEGYVSEVNLWIEPWIQSVSTFLKEGALLLIDYGYEEAEYYSPYRSEGTLACYHRHHRNEDPLANPGEQDITAHVDFSLVAEAGIRAGLTLEGYTSQALFLAHLLTFTCAENDPIASQHLRRLMHPLGMGEVFKVIAFSKALPSFEWKGFQEA